jgi:hypothetical protein
VQQGEKGRPVGLGSRGTGAGQGYGHGGRVQGDATFHDTFLSGADLYIVGDGEYRFRGQVGAYAWVPDCGGAGDADSFSSQTLAEIFRDLYVGERSGVLNVSRGNIEKRIISTEA